MIRDLRVSKGLTQIALANLIGTTRSAVAMWESGTSSPRADKLPELARILGCTVDELLRPVEQECPA